MQGFRTAGLGVRALASALDCLILAVPSYVVMSGEYYIRFQYYPFGVCVALGVLYSVVLLGSAWQATAGMRLLKIHVVRAHDCRRLNYATALARYLAYNAAFLLLIALPTLDPRLPANYAGQKGARYDAFRHKEERQEPMTAEERRFLDEAYSRVGMLKKSSGPRFIVTCGYTLVIAITIGATKRNTGLHDLLCGTLVLSGLPSERSATGPPPTIL